MSELKQLATPRGGRSKLWTMAMVALMSGFFGTAFQLIAPQPAKANLMMMMGKAKDVADAEARAMLFAWRLGSSVNANAEQKQKLIAVAKGAANDIFPLVERMKGNIKQMFNLLRAESIDEAAVEKLRQEQLGIVDTISRRKTQAMLEMLATLNYDQRKDMISKFEYMMMHKKKKWRDLTEDLDDTDE